MSYENTSGLGVSTQYGPRGTSAVATVSNNTGTDRVFTVHAAVDTGTATYDGPAESAVFPLIDDLSGVHQIIRSVEYIGTGTEPAISVGGVALGADVDLTASTNLNNITFAGGAGWSGSVVVKYDVVTLSNEDKV